jgi:N-acetylglucosamine-6-phosphate deacetylase
MKAIKNIKLVTKEGILLNRLLIFDEKIIDIVDEEYTPSNIEVIDGGGNYLSPGFINVHVHGCSGYDVMDEDENAIENISKNIVKTGVTAFLPTTMTMEFRRIERALERIKKSMKGCSFAEILGCHLEGPFISRKYKGAQDAKYIIEPDFKKISKYKDVIKIVTMAPEVSGGIEFIKECIKNNIVVSIGHSNATFDEAKAAIDAGASHITHIFNAMTPLNHRSPGVVGAALSTGVTCELICDDIHIHPAVQAILLNIKGEDKIVLITDAMRACLLKDGQYDLGGQQVNVNGMEARLEDGTIAGSLLTLNRGIKNFMNNTNAPIWQAVNMASLNPARILGVENRKGSIEKGKDADLVLLDNDLDVRMTFVKGRIVYSV